MKRYIKSSSQLDILKQDRGSAGPADKRGGKIKFGRGDAIDLGNGWFIEFPTGVVRINLNTGEADTYCNVYLRRDEKFWERGVQDSKEYTGCSLEEVSAIYNAAKNATYEELVEIICRPWTVN